MCIRDGYKHRRTIIRGGKVIHLLPPRHNVEHHGRDWDAIQAVTPDQARSVVMVYRALGGLPERTIHPVSYTHLDVYKRQEQR